MFRRRSSVAPYLAVVEVSLSLRMRVRSTGMEAAMMVMAPSDPPQRVTATVSTVWDELVKH